MSEASSSPLVPVSVLDRLLSQQPWVAESLQPFAGRSWRVSLGGTLLIQAVINESGRLGEHTGAVDCALTADPTRLAAALSANAADRLSAVRIEGDAALAQALSTLVAQWRPDLEAWLARWVGPDLAHGVRRTSVEVGRDLADGLWRLAENGAEFLVHEEQMLVAPTDLQNWASQVRLLRDDLARLSKRVDRLAAQRPGEH